MKRGIIQSMVTATMKVMAYTRIFLEKYFFTLKLSLWFAPPTYRGANHQYQILIGLEVSTQQPA